MSERKKILLAEEDPEIVEYLLNFFSFLGDFEIKRVTTAVELLAGVDALEPELVILDLNTTRVDSRQILGEIKGRHHATKILAITTRRGEEKTLVAQGAQQVVTKPVDFADLGERVKKILGAGVEEPAEYARLLIADDEEELNWCLREIFERLGFEAYTAQDGEEAFRIFKEKACNLVILDLKMPKLGGVDLIHLLEKSITPPPPKAIVIITAGLAEALSELRRQDYPVLDKPLDLEVLKQRILEACEKYSLALRKETGKSLKEPG